MWLPSGIGSYRHTEVGASIQCLNKIRAILLRETAEFINSAHLNLFQIIIWLWQSPSINLLQLRRVCLASPEPSAWAVCPRSTWQCWGLQRVGEAVVGQGGQRSLRVSSIWKKENFILASVFLSRSKTQLRWMCLRQPGSFPVRMFCISQRNSENCCGKDSAVGSEACTVLNAALFLSLIFRIKG